MRIAIVGAGISGLGAAYLLARAHEVEIFERDARPGGHVNTISHDDERFRRTWDFYLAFCEVAVRHERALRRAAGIEPGVNLDLIFDAVGIRELLRRVYGVEVEGGEHIPAAGPAVLAANHESLADPFFLGVATTRPIHYMAKAELWRNPIVGRLMTWFGTFPVERGGGDSNALLTASGCSSRERCWGSSRRGRRSPAEPPRHARRGRWRSRPGRRSSRSAPSTRRRPCDRTR